MDLLRLRNSLNMALRLSGAIVLGDIFPHLLLHIVVKTRFALVIADGLVRVNLPVPGTGGL
jgi:hypothetical protein